ncbi:hypothetical protein CASFOL_038933 [Castilleja foliolosa]|uniref:Carboxypeptidase n=1 Tax=Castilleja foliolosa TaxID=1961234 RepID=A0ABD3BJH5_9LAMI
MNLMGVPFSIGSLRPNLINQPISLFSYGLMEGPGCSLIGYGAALELGPLRVAQKGAALEFNKQARNKEANLLFVESPVGVGSHTPIHQMISITLMINLLDTYNFLVKWLQKFSQYKRSEFFISGESYAGHYVPQLAELIHNRNMNKKKYQYINLRGFIVGNPQTSKYYDYKGILEYAWSHSVISDQNYDKAKRTCEFNKVYWSDECVSAMEMLWAQYNNIDMYNIYAPSCLLNQTTLMPTKTRTKRKMDPGGYDPCFDIYIKKYFNRRDVQTALHVKQSQHGDTVKWKACNYSIFRETYDQNVFSVLPIYTKLITKRDQRIWVYSGDVAGRIVEYEGLTFVTVRGAGHMVPVDKPNEAFALIHSYLFDQPLPTTRY